MTMMRYFPKWLVLSSAAVIASTGIALACADYFFGNGHDSVFTPEAFVSASYNPVFYTANDLFYGSGDDSGTSTRFNDEIIKDWNGYLGGKLSAKDIAFLMLNDSATAIVKQLGVLIDKKQPLMAQYSKWNLGDEKVKAFVKFILFAKKIEVASVVNDPWDYDAAKAPRVLPGELGAVTSQYNSATDPFLKNRYWFQVMKASFYSSSKKDAIAFFEKTSAAAPKNSLYYRAMAYVAGAEYVNKNFAKSNYLYSQVFDHCAPLRLSATFNFHPQDDANFEASLAMAKTPDEKCAMWALHGYYTDEMRAIQSIYSLNPANVNLDFLLTRLINKVEVSSNSDGRLAIPLATITDNDLQLITKIANEGKVSNVFLWNSGAGYLMTLAGKFADAAKYYDKAIKVDPHKSAIAGNEVRILRLINTVASVSNLDNKSEAKLLPELRWLFAIKLPEDDIFRYQYAVSWTRKMISTQYNKQNNFVMAELFLRDAAYYQSPSNLDAMKAFYSKEKKSEWEQFALSFYEISLSDIFEYQGVMATYQSSLVEGIQYLQQSNEGSAIELYGNPFNGKIVDCHDCDHAAPQKVKYSKLSLLRKMKEMQDHVDRGEDTYNNCLLLANAYYNMSYYGNARAFYYGDIINQYGNYIDKWYQPILFSCEKARFYYQKAFDAATNPEQKAKCAYMLAKCERNDFYTSEYFTKDYYYGDGEVNYKAWKGFQMLRRDYSSTKYYKDVINECGYFRSYVGQ